MVWNGEKIGRITFLTQWPHNPLVGQCGGSGIKVQSRGTSCSCLLVFFTRFLLLFSEAIADPALLRRRRSILVIFLSLSPIYWWPLDKNTNFLMNINSGNITLLVRKSIIVLSLTLGSPKLFTSLSSLSHITISLQKLNSWSRSLTNNFLCSEIGKLIESHCSGIYLDAYCLDVELGLLINFFENYEQDILTKSVLSPSFVPLRCPAWVCLFIGETLLGL